MKINIEFDIKDRWVNYFMSFLNYMQWCSNVEHSEIISFYVDGDGDFRFNFNTDLKYQIKNPIKYKFNDTIKTWDAG